MTLPRNPSLATLLLTTALFAGCDEERHDEPGRTDGAAATDAAARRKNLDALYSDAKPATPIINVPDGLEVKLKERPLQARNMEEKQRKRTESIIASAGGGALGRMIAYKDGTVIVHLLTEGKDGKAVLRRCDVPKLTAKLSGGAKGGIDEFELLPVPDAKKPNEPPYMFRGIIRQVLVGKQLHLTVLVPLEGAEEKVIFVIPEGYEPF